MKFNVINSVLEAHWKEGFLHDLQHEVFDPKKGLQLLQALKQVDQLLDDEFVDIRFARLVWPIPLFLERCTRAFRASMPEEEWIQLKNQRIFILGEIDRIINYI